MRNTILSSAYVSSSEQIVIETYIYVEIRVLGEFLKIKQTLYTNKNSNICETVN